MNGNLRYLSSLSLAFLLFGFSDAISATQAESPLTMVVMDPLAAPLSCPCVEGYAQRKYEVLGDYVARKLKRPVKVIFTESLKLAVDNDKFEQADIIIGKDSVVRFDSKRIGEPVEAVARLTGKDGKTTQTGLIVVRKDDPAKRVDDLNQYRIFFGPEDCDEKHAAALQLLKSHRVTISDKLEVSLACSDGACKVIELGDGNKTAAVISSYAAPLLEGCGTIKKGDLRIVGETKPVPFVTAFVAKRLDDSLKREIQNALWETSLNANILIALESQSGFVKVEPNETVKKK